MSENAKLDGFNNAGALHICAVNKSKVHQLYARQRFILEKTEMSLEILNFLYLRQSATTVNSAMENESRKSLLFQRYSPDGRRDRRESPLCRPREGGETNDER